MKHFLIFVFHFKHSLISVCGSDAMLMLPQQINITVITFYIVSHTQTHSHANSDMQSALESIVLLKVTLVNGD